MIVKKLILRDPSFVPMENGVKQIMAGNLKSVCQKDNLLI